MNITYYQQIVETEPVNGNKYIRDMVLTKEVKNRHYAPRKGDRLNFESGNGWFDDVEVSDTFFFVDNDGITVYLEDLKLHPTRFDELNLKDFTDYGWELEHSYRNEEDNKR